jgi:ferredoxin-NADP reductase
MENIPLAAKHKVKILKADYLTHNVKRFLVTKPAGYTFIPGQATEVSINTEEFAYELRPFTFTSINESEHLEFIIKIYDNHNGTTKKLRDINEGDELFVHDVFGALHYKGPGLFLAGGAGITPFISIFRKLKQDNKSDHNMLLFANRTERDIILKNELGNLLGGNYINVLEESNTPETISGRIDTELLKKYVSEKFSFYYICGTENFTNAMVKNLANLGIPPDKVVFEK